MLNTVKQVLKYFIENNKIPQITDLQLSTEVKLLQDKKGSVFVTLYKGGEIIGSKGNVMPIENSFVDELIKSSVEAYLDDRYNNKNILLDDIKIRIDLIKNKKLLQENEKNSNINPLKNGIIAIKNNYDKLAVILPNISIGLKDSKDLPKILSHKLDEEFREKDYIIYQFETTTFTDF